MFLFVCVFFGFFFFELFVADGVVVRVEIVGVGFYDVALVI